MRPPVVYIRLLGLVSWPAGGVCAPIGDVYSSSGGVYPLIGSGFVAGGGA